MENTSKNYYEVFWDDENKIGRIFVSGEIDIELTKKIIEGGKKIQKKHCSENEKMKWLVNADKVTKPVLSLRVREIMSEAIKFIGAGKIAITGKSIIIKTVMIFIMAAAGQKKFKYFKTEEESLKWLKG